VLNINFDE